MIDGTLGEFTSVKVPNCVLLKKPQFLKNGFSTVFITLVLGITLMANSLSSYVKLGNVVVLSRKNLTVKPLSIGREI